MFSWNIPYVPSDNEAICSPAFAKWGRQWRITFEKRGHQSMFGLKYAQGVGPMHLAVSFFLEESNGSRHIMNIPVAKINSGEMTEGDRSKLIPNTITVKMEHVEPVIKCNN